MSGFSNPVSNAVGTLIRTVLKSLNYVANTTGWAIFKNGNADFATGSFRGTITVTGPNGAQIIIDTGATYPNLTFWSPDHTNSGGLSITGGASGADMLMTSGKFTPADTIPRRSRLWMDGAVDQTLLHVFKESNQASLGGNVLLTSGSIFVGYRDSDGGIFYYLTLDKNGNGGFSSGVTFHTPNGSVQEMDAGSALNFANGAGFQRRNGGAVSVAGDPGKGIINYVTTIGAATASANTVAGAPFSAEIVCIQLTNHVFEDGRCYGVIVFGGYNAGSNTTSANFKIRQGATTAGTLLWDYWWTPPIPGTGGGVGPAVMSGPGYIKRNVGAGNTTSSIVLTLLTNNAGTGQHYSDATHARGLYLWDVGVATDFPFATAI